MRKLIKKLKNEWGLWKEFWREGKKYVFWRGYAWFSKFEKGKDFIARLLYRQRGRFARPFVHTAMAGLMAMAITLAPVLASSFPGVGQNLQEEQLPSTQVIEVTSNETATEVSDRVRDAVVEYTVKSGDTVSQIADKFGVTTDTIRWENNLASLNAIKPGQIIRILPVTGIRHKVTRGETIYTIAKKYDANPQAIVDFPFNIFTDNETFALATGQELMVPDGTKPKEAPWSPTSSYLAQKTPDAGIVSALGRFIWPIGGSITQRFTSYHRGVDIATAYGTPVLAADAGTIVIAGWPDNSGYGIRVEIDHGNGYKTLYGHLSKVSVVVGQRVNRGDQIGLEGSTGRSTGPHLHFEIFKGGVKVNPLTLLK